MAKKGEGVLRPLWLGWVRDRLNSWRSAMSAAVVPELDREEVWQAVTAPEDRDMLLKASRLAQFMADKRINWTVRYRQGDPAIMVTVLAYIHSSRLTPHYASRGPAYATEVLRGRLDEWYAEEVRIGTEFALALDAIEFVDARAKNLAEMLHLLPALRTVLDGVEEKCSKYYIGRDEATFLRWYKEQRARTPSMSRAWGPTIKQESQRLSALVAQVTILGNVTAPPYAPTLTLKGHIPSVLHENKMISL